MAYPVQLVGLTLHLVLPKVAGTTKFRGDGT